MKSSKRSWNSNSGAGLGITREEADFGGIWLPGGVGAAGAFSRWWEALRHFGVRALVFGPTQSPNLAWSLELLSQLLVAQVAQLRD